MNGRIVGYWGGLGLLMAVAIGSAGRIAAGDVLDEELAAAKGALEAGKSLEAASRFNALGDKVEGMLVEKPGDAHLNYILGCVCMYSGDDDVAGKSLDLAVKLEPKNGEYLLARGTLSMYEEKYEVAVGQIKKAMELGAGGGASWALLGDAQMQAGQQADARGSYQHAVEANPKESRYQGKLGGALMAVGKADEAVAAYRKALELDPKYALAYANIGQIEQARGNAAAALEAYEKVLGIEPEDWRALSKEVQIYEGMGKVKERDLAREKIFALHKAEKMDDPAYCRDQFKHGETLLMAFEYFELKGPMAVRYSFAVLKGDGKTVERKISLGSYEATTAAARATGQIPVGGRMFHLDVYSEKGHETLGMFTTEPSYEVTKKMVMDYLDGKLKVISATSGPANGGGK